MQKKIVIVVSMIFLSASLFSQTEKRIDINLKNATLKEFFSKVEKQTNYTFMYNNLDASQTINYTKTQVKVATALKDVLSSRNISYDIQGNQIILKNLKKNVSTSPHQIKGTVKDNTGQPLVGVTIMEVGTTNGTISDVNGNYSIEVSSPDSKLRYSYIGFVDQIKAANKQAISITMSDDTKALDEVVVVGYGSVKKTSLSAAISTMKGAEIANKPVADMSNSFVGRVSGVSGVQTSGQPGSSGTSISIRGIATSGNSAPLYVVDGVQRSYNEIDPSTVASMTILKDAAAVAPYGMGGANGVVLITTKRGKTGAPTLSYNGYAGFQQPTHVPKMVNSYQYTLLKNEADINDGQAIEFSDADIAMYKKTVDGASDADRDKYPNANPYKDTAKKTSLMQHHDLSLTGGNDIVTYYASLGYLNQGGQWSVFGYQRYNGTLNLDVNATKTTKVSFSVAGYQSRTQSSMSGAGSIMDDAYRNQPTLPVYYTNGLWGTGNSGRSTVGDIYHSGYNNGTTNQLFTTFSITQKLDVITKGLSIKGLVSYDPRQYHQKKWATIITAYTADFSTTPYTFNEGSAVGAPDGSPRLDEETNSNTQYTSQASINYARTFGKHSISLLGLAESKSSNYWVMGTGRAHYPIAIDELDNGGTGAGDVTNYGHSDQTANVGFVYRASYSYDGKYFLEASGRYDGSYLFAPGHRWGFFPSVSAAWNLAEENFIKDNYQWVDMLKVRTSYGVSGNFPNNAYQFLTGYNSDANSAFFNGAATTGIYEKTPQANPNITWERANKFDIGLDGSFWNGLLTAQFDYFSEDRSDMLISPKVSVPLEYGTTMPDVNAGEMTNHGFEISLGSHHQFSNGMDLSVNANFTYAQNKVVQMFETSSTYDNPNRRQTGRPYKSEFGYQAIGYFTKDDFQANGTLKPGIPWLQGFPNVHPGDLRYAKLSNDGQPYIDENDQTCIGKPSLTNGMPPGIIYGLNPHLTWKGFDLDLLFQGAAMCSAPLGKNMAMPFYWGGSATELQYTDHWTPTSTNAQYPRISNEGSQSWNNNSAYSSFWVRNGAFVRFKNLELGYTLPKVLTSKWGMQRLRVYVSGNNIYTWTPYIKEDIDPEAGWGASYYFQQQTLTFGVNVSF